MKGMVKSFIQAFVEFFNWFNEGLEHKIFTVTILFLVILAALIFYVSDIALDQASFLRIFVIVFTVGAAVSVYLGILIWVLELDETGKYNKFVSSLGRSLDSLKYQRGDVLIYVCVFGFSIVSLVSTSTGLLVFMGAGRGGAAGTDVVGLVPYIMAGCVQIMIVVSVAKLSDYKRGFFARAKWVPIYLVMFLVSSGFGYGYWYDQVLAEEEFYSNIDRGENRFIDSVTAAHEKLNSAVQISLQVATLSNRAFQKEYNDGFQCHSSVPRGNGVRYEYLRDSSETFDNISENLKQTQKNMPSLDEVRAKYNKVRVGESGLADSNIQSYAKTLNSKLNTAKSAVENFKQQYKKMLDVGKSIVPDEREIAALRGKKEELCPLDPKRDLDGIVDNMDTDFSISINDIYIVDKDDKRDVLLFAFKRFGGLVLDSVTFKKEVFVRENFLVFLPFLLNAILDISILLLTLYAGLRRKAA